MFVKNDEVFECQKCKAKVEKLGYTSRDHCNVCMYSLHVDITPGDRQNTCKGLLRPVNVITKNGVDKIEYVCTKCGQIVRNIVARDDSREELLKIVEEYAKYGGK